MHSLISFWIFNNNYLKFFFFKIGVFYDDSYDQVPDIVEYSINIINRLYKTSYFEFEYSINKVNLNNSYKLTKISI